MEIFIDASTLGNGTSSAVAGIGIFYGANDIRNYSGPYDGPRPVTNQRAELWVAVKALEKLLVPEGTHIIYKSDSQYLVKGITLWYPSWKKKNILHKKENIDIFTRLDALLTERKKTVHISYQHVPGHVGLYGNEMADTLSRVKYGGGTT